MKNLAILGSTGSIGKNTLAVVRSFPDKFKVVALSVNSDIEQLRDQINEFHPALVCVRDKAEALKLEAQVRGRVKVFSSDDGLVEMVKDKRISRLMFAISGSSALLPLVSAIKSGKDIALANKEALVMAGNIIMPLVEKHKVKMLPVDSEQSAIWQSLGNADKQNVKTVYLTASGGPLKDMARSEFKSVTLEKVLRHPRWKMGKKITVDSATLMNKGLELLEAMFLFGLSVDQIKVLIHPEAIIHSMVEFNDAILMAQLSETDMRIPIQYALTYPERLGNNLPRIDFYKLKNLHFAKPDFDKFPCLRLAYQAARELGTMPAVLNAANEEAVDKFLKKELKFIFISKVVEAIMRKHKNLNNPSLADILSADAWARDEANNIKYCHRPA